MRTLLALLLCLAAVSAKVVQWEMKKQMPTAKQIVARRLLDMPMRNKYASRFKTGQQKFKDWIDNFYLSTIALGTPDQSFQIQLDTGSSNLWLVDVSCTAPECDGFDNPLLGPKYQKHKYDRSKSSTFKDDGRYFQIIYGSGSCEGNLVVDKLNFGGLTVKNQTWGAASSIAEVFGYFPMDGILGLGWPGISEDDVTPPFQMVMPQLDKPLFTVWLDRHIKPSEGQTGGLITYGAIDDKNCDTSDITYVNLSAELWWEFPYQGFAVASYKNTKKGKAISDTGTSFLYGPYADVSAIVTASNADYDFSTGLYTVPCDKAGSLPDLVFTISGKKIAIPGKEHVTDLELGGGQCALGVDSSDFGGEFDWLLGDAFIRTWCQIYDVGQKRIGLAKGKHSEV